MCRVSEAADRLIPPVAAAVRQFLQSCEPCNRDLPHDPVHRQDGYIRNDPYIRHNFTQPDRLKRPIDKSNR